MTPTRIYVRTLLPLLQQGKILGAAHITGGGLIENIPRVLPDHLSVQLMAHSWSIPPVFKWIAKEGKVDPHEMLRTFNCGVGMILIVRSAEAEQVSQYLKSLDSAFDQDGIVIGHLVVRKDPMEPQVLFSNTADIFK